MKLRKLIALGAALGAGILLSPASAGAAELVKITPCWEVGLNAQQVGFFESGTAPFAFAAECPDLRMGMLEFIPVGNGDRGAQVMTVGSRLTRLTASLAGGPSPESGLLVRLRVCSFDHCGRALVPSGTSTPTDGELTILDGIPENPVTVLIDAVCNSVTGCPYQPDSIISDLKLEYLDEVAPRLTVVDGSGVPIPAVSPWMNSSSYPSWTAEDDETFIASYSIQAGSDPPVVSNCFALPDGSYPNMSCYAGEQSADTSFPTDFEGTLPVQVSATDAAGNSTTSNVTLRRDSSGPDPVEAIDVGANADGWINEMAFTAHWINPGEKEETADQSGIASARFEIRNAQGELVREGSVIGDEIDSISSFVTDQGSYYIYVTVVDRAGNVSDVSSQSFNLDLIDPAAPIVDSVPIVNSQSADDGLTISWSNVADTQDTYSGICGYRSTINSLPDYDPVEGDGVTTLSADQTQLEVSAEELAGIGQGVQYLHLRAVSCAGRLGQTADVAIAVDTEPPMVSSQPLGGGWLAPGKKLVLKAVDGGAGNSVSGVSSITYSIDGNPEVTVNGASVSLPLSQGMRPITVQAEDFAHNRSEQITIEAGIDLVAPTAAFAASDPADPAMVRANVSDGDSGVADAWIEYRPPGSLTWARLIGAAAGDPPRVLAVRFPDDDSLPSGDYELRVVSRDQAGNTSTTTSRVGGETARVTLPLRPPASLGLSVAPSSTEESSRSLMVEFGKRVHARGRLLDARGVPVAGASITILQSVSGGQRTQAGTATTNASGDFGITVDAGPSRILEARFFGNALVGSAKASATFSVRGGISMKRPPKKLSHRKILYLRGNVRLGPVGLPKGGARIAIQHKSGSRWSGFELSGRTFSDGSFKIRWGRTKLRHGPVRLVLRAVVIAEQGWPYANGYSQVRSVVIN